MKKLLFIVFETVLNLTAFSQQLKIISDGTIKFSIYNYDNNKQSNLGSKVIYIKGKDIRVDLTSKRFSQSIFYNGHTGDVIVLKIIGQSKYISAYNAEEWKKQNEIFKDVSISFTGKTKNILNYDCKQAILTLKNGNEYTIYYIPFYKPSVADNSVEFKDIPGLVLEYESNIKGKGNIVFVAEEIDFDPVPSIQFDIPTKGFRLLDQK